MVYLDTSILLVYTLTQSIELERFQAVDRFFAKIISRTISAATSFYALHELYVFALDNTSDLETGYAFGKSSLEKILGTPLRILPFVGRKERSRLAKKFALLRDPSDIPHAISAFLANCEAIVAYDDHFKAILHIIPYKTPLDYL